MGSLKHDEGSHINPYPTMLHTISIKKNMNDGKNIPYSIALSKFSLFSFGKVKISPTHVKIMNIKFRIWKILDFNTLKANFLSFTSNDTSTSSSFELRFCPVGTT